MIRPRGVQPSPNDVDEALEATKERQLKASNPQASAWVSANAGTGKTHVLTMRTLRLLLAGTAPERILCLTYTKAAAAQMSTRVFNTLAKWVTLAEEGLAGDLRNLLGRDATSEERLQARTLFTRAIETPGGLKVQTIHAFAERLLQRFPLEAGVAPGFQTLDEDTGAELLADAIDATLSEALALESGGLRDALETAVAYAAEDGFEDLLRRAMSERDWLRGLASLLRAGDGSIEQALQEYEAGLRRIFDVRPHVGPEDVARELDSVLPNGDIKYAVEVLLNGSKQDVSRAETLKKVWAAHSQQERITWLRKFFLTDAGEPRASLMTKALREAEAGHYARLEKAQEKFHELVVEQTALKAVQATMALMPLACRVHEHFEVAKARRAALDFDDLIEKTVELLSSREATDWVLYKLDGGVDHILVDESQDTSPRQWRIVEALAAEFFAGEGREQEGATRTLFAVGDEKQSIYSFQGAAPEMFAKMGERFKTIAEAAGLSFESVPLDLSFRTVRPVLNAVDEVFSDHLEVPGVGSSQRKVHHEVKRIADGGLVEVWPTEKPAAALSSDAFDPLNDTSASSSVERLAGHVAEQIRRFIETQEELTSKGRPIRPGDILILCRNRRPFAAPMVAALKERNIPVAGADRLLLTEQLAVQDLMALGHFTTLPEDDLTLAALLKSPLIGFDDDLLFDAAHDRKTTLWKALIDRSQTDERMARAQARLAEWRRRADFLPPFEFYAKALEEDGLRAALLARLGHEAADPIDEFLNLAIAYDDREAPSLTGFLSWLEHGSPQIKRDMDQGANEVRVMTVHASKGLEAPIVFLPDTCAPATGNGGHSPLTPLSDCGAATGSSEQAEPASMQVWTVKGASKLSPVQAARRDSKRREQEEHNRLLYVAMTRAEDRLYVCGFERARGRGQGCWYDVICNGVEAIAEKTTLGDGRRVLRIAAEQTGLPASGHASETTAQAEQPPPWALKRAPRVAHVSLPLAPSQLAPYDSDAEGEPVAGPAAGAKTAKDAPPPDPAQVSPLEASDAGDKFLRGTLTHALFQHLPNIAQADRSAAGERFLAVRGATLPKGVRQAVLGEVLHILETQEYSELFSLRSRAEVPIAADLARPMGDGPNLRLSGSIDRLVDLGERILIVDYKTNRSIPERVEDVAEAYLLQLAAYRLALKEIYPGKSVDACLLWTRAPLMMPIGVDLIEHAEQRLFEVSRQAG